MHALYQASLVMSRAPAARRVYDALNVLEALDIIGKEKKSVKWRGFPETQAAHHFAVQQTEAQARQMMPDQPRCHLQAISTKCLAVFSINVH